MTGHVDNAEGDPTGRLQPGEADVDCDPAFLLLGEAVGVDTGQGTDQRRLAVVNMPRRAQHEVALVSQR